MYDGDRHSLSARVPSLAAAVLAALAVLLLDAGQARAQAGVEAAAQTKPAAEWAKRGQQPAGERALPRPQVVPARPAPAAAAAESARLPRKLSGAPGRVRGAVVERSTRAAVPGVILSLTSTEPQYTIDTHLARTDSAGRYEFPAVEPGRWALAVAQDRLPKTFAARPAERVVIVARRDSLWMSPIELTRTACVAGQVVWADGYVFSAAPLVVAPRDTTLPVAEGAADGIGDYEICSAPADSVMVWLLLRDGRRLGLPARLAPERPARVGFRPQPLDRMEGTALRLEARAVDGRPVLKARIVVVGRKLAVGAEPTLVFSREALADHNGGADFRLPYGTYEILVLNPREGQFGRVEQFVVAPGVPAQVTHEVTLRGESTAERRASWRQELLDRAERFQRLWAP